jgi:hypothetical protein
VKPRKEYVIVRRLGLSGSSFKDVYFMERRYVMDRHIKDREHNRALFKADYVATGLSYKQAKRMMKLFKEN